jgi:hypothetical protein
MAKDHVPIIRRPTDEELNGMIAASETKGFWVIVGALLDYKQLRKEKEAHYAKEQNDKTRVLGR